MPFPKIRQIRVGCWFVLLGFFSAACSGPQAIGPTDPISSSTAEVDSSTVQVPYANPPQIDGILTDGEWERAVQFAMTNGGTVSFVHDGQYLYVGIDGQGLGFGHICWKRGDQVWILHSSAALGSAAYQMDEQHWRPVWDFEWCCRSTVLTLEREALLEQEGWMASIGYLGNQDQMEYQIAWEGQIQLAVLYQTGQGQDTIFLWPQAVSDACVDLATGAGELVNPAQFEFEDWVVLEADE